MARFLREGTGWRLGWNPDAALFQGLVGGDRWAVELTAAEFEDFCRGAQTLATSLAAIAAELMDEERVACEQETERVWMEAEGFPQSFSLRFILLTGRNVEGEWPPAATQELLQAIPHLQLF